ncbi:branched-chain amino acid aminotransferase [Streptomyces sp. NBC_00876]|uniref:branched-chain amino acid aminotransferase n=1 Tax=Streptomyces sp. NBC_00876 TaxID=2975853 RepID=UPI003863CC06|nr:branched-chain amino acid aminotransferase [Streptomyces sp. NBC_00876]
MTESAVESAESRAVAPDTGPARFAFGETFTDHMVTAAWTVDHGWEPGTLEPRGPLSMDPAMVGLHYGQVVFEGLKAHRQADGTVGVFRPADHALRFQRSARRLAMPELPVETFLRAVDDLVSADAGLLPDDPALSLYLRPVLYASEPVLALRPARQYRFVLIAFLTGGFFADRPDPVSVWISRDQSRAAPGGTGDVKCAGNYAPGYLAQQQAALAGCHQVIWLDPAERRWVEEMGGMNIFFVRGTGTDARVVTPPRSGTILPGVTRDSVFGLAERLGLRTGEERLSVDEWREGCRSGELTEAFACGTAAGITPIGTVHDDDRWSVGTGEPGPVTLALRDALTAAQQGRTPDLAHWIRRVAGTARAR